MSVDYAPPVTGAPVDGRTLYEPIMEGPAFARTRAMGRWHRVRSGYHALDEWRDEIRTVWHLWCGPACGTGFTNPPILTDDPDERDPICGTCQGRWEGWRNDRNLIFQPRLLTPPKDCPGSRDIAADDMGRCGLCWHCGQVIPWRVYGWTGRPLLQRHDAGDTLIEPCLMHGWRQMRRVNGVTVCKCGGQP